jgi:hypothetical protein
MIPGCGHDRGNFGASERTRISVVRKVSAIMVMSCCDSCYLAPHECTEAPYASLSKQHCGAVTVTTDATTVCTITLAAGTGNCSPTAGQLPVGAATLIASYGGDDTYDASSAPTASLQVTSSTPPPPTTATTTTTLGLSKASITYGDEQAEKISVKVASAANGVSSLAGSVTVSSGAIKVCAFSLSPSGTGSCALKPVALPPGTPPLTATYAGNTAFAPSVSAVKSLKVVREPTTTTVSCPR